jgi:hypothetical protein
MLGFTKRAEKENKPSRRAESISSYLLRIFKKYEGIVAGHSRN